MNDRAFRHSKGEPRQMKKLIHGILMVAALASAVSLSAQTAQSAPTARLRRLPTRS